MPAYPGQYEMDVVLKDGSVVHVRPIRPEDAQALYRFFHRLGRDSVYQRFFRAKSDLSPDELRYFTQLDYHHRMAFAVLREGQIIAVGRYERLPQEPTVAEVAFAVEDSQQNRGIGTQLLQLLTTYAREHAISSFRAYLLADNYQMMRVFRNSGYTLQRHLEEGVYTVDFPTLQTSEAQAVAEERERRAVAASVLPLLYPTSVAVVGASRHPASIGGRLFRNLLLQSFSGPVYPVNPAADTVGSVRAYRSVLDVPDAIDLAFVVVPAPEVVEVARQCAQKGVRGLVVISAGFSEVGEEGARRERRLLEVVRAAGMRMVGPNCMGLVNTDPAVRLDGTFGPVFPPPGNVAMSSQSGALGIAILDYARQLDVGISTFVSVGNKADVSGNDLLLYWEDDPSTDVILLYLESFGNPRRFARIARRIARRKPIVAVKSGRTEAGTRAAGSHTGALATLDLAVDALFHQAGVIRTETLDELFDVTSLLANQPLPKGGRVGIITNAGGPAILAADALESNGLELPELSEGLQSELRRALVPEASTRNPVDLVASGGPNEYRHSLEALLQSDEVDAVMAIYIPASPEDADQVAEVIRRAASRQSGEKTLLAVFMRSKGAPDELATAGVRVPSYLFPEAAARALATTVRYAEWRRRPQGEAPRFDDARSEDARRVVEAALERMGEQGGWLEPVEVHEVLGAFGLAGPASAVAHSEEEAARLADGLSGPVVLKVIAPSVLHKSEVGGVALDLRGDEAVRAAYRKVTEAVPDARGALVQEFVPEGHEVLIGMTEDPSFGPIMVFGLGGIFVELLRDVAFRIVPLTDVDAREMVHDIRSLKLLQGYRGNAPADLPALEEALLRASALVEALHEVAEMDLNPVKVLPPGRGLRVVDARMRVRRTEATWTAGRGVDVPAMAGRPL
ncbi:MAG: GNAT family N-acetyltransferase [Actinomycetota bacterium]|nr:GNAT family N-acetyltransferase [Actinomycetota bacterium]